MPGTDRSKAIAVIGMSCRLPGAPSPAAFWDLLRHGRDAITDPPDGREGRRRGGYLDQVDRFDADFFGISPREAAALDPQQRLLLELAWEAVEDARIAPGSLRGSRTAVITGAMADDYGLLAGRGPASPYTLTGVSRSLLANRVSHHLGLTGPSLSVDTGQSSSLFSVHLAAGSLRRGEARLALAGGVQLNLAAEAEQRTEQFGALSPGDRCRTFDAGADGYVRGEGGGLVLLKPLADALADGDRVYCVILGSAASHGTGPGLTVPSEQAQAEVLRLACAQAGAEPSAVQYVELHGTGTAAGDPVEAAALGAVLGAGRPAGRELLAGSAKTNIGHLEGAAGIAGLIKAALSVAHRQIPASLNFATPALPLAGLGLRVADRALPWPGDGPQLAGVSSFGMGGANCHLILGGPPPAVTAPVPGPGSPGRAVGALGAPRYLPWVLSGRTDQALRAQAAQLASAVPGLAGPSTQAGASSPPTPGTGTGAMNRAGTDGSEAGGRAGPGARTEPGPEPQAEPGPAPRAERGEAVAGPGSLADIGLSLATTRTRLEHRAAVVAADRDGFLAGLRAVAEGTRRAEADPDGPGARVLAGRPAGGPLAILFPGQGTQRPGMGRDLHEAFPVFARALDAVCAEADQHLDRPLRDVMWSGDGLDQTQYTQPAVFAVEVAMYRLWESWGLRPGLLAGHSIGEIAAAHAAGVFTLEDAVTFVAARGRLMQALPPGTMIALQATEDEVAAALDGLPDRLAIAAVNGPSAVVISGEDAAARQVADRFRAEGRRARPLKVSHAFHSPLMDPVLGELAAVAARLALRPARGPAVVSCVTGQPADPGELASPAYWARHARQPVRFAGGLAALHDAGARLFLEGGPGHALTTLARAALPDGCAFVTPGAAGREEIVAALASLHLHGAEPDWPALFGPAARRVDLPGYPFQRSRHWLGSTGPGASRPAPIPRTGAGRDRAAPPDGQPDGPAGSDGAGARPAGGGQAAGGLAGLRGAGRDRAVADLVARETADLLGHDDPGVVDPHRAFNDLGFDSRMAVELRERLAAATGLDLPADLLFGCPTGAELTANLRAGLAGRDGGEPGHCASAGEADGADASERDGARAGRPRAGDGDAGQDADGDRVAIVAMGCRYPGGVSSPDELWRLAAEGTDAITPFPANRGWDLARLHGEHGPDGASGPREGGFLLDADQFDPAFFGISPREAGAMDPQQRVLLETVWDAFERYGLDLPGRRGQPVGVFAGLMEQDYGPRMHEAGAGAGGYRLTGGSTSVASGRIAYLFGLEGPAVTVNTACSSSLVSLHLAAQSVARGECDLAVAAGVTVMAAPGMFVDFTAQGGLAPDGRCKPFSAAADGTAWSEGAGVLVLERLADARRNGHQVLAVLAGTATNQDGASNGLSAPSGQAQERVIRQALAAAGLEPGQVDAVEAHGTGTPLGDPIEARALTATYGQGRPDDRRVLVGSLKSNLGHTQAAAGAGGVIKMVEAIRRGWLPPTLHAATPSSEIDWAASGLALLTEGRDWPGTGQPRRAAVSSFGISGTNAHVILEQAPAGPRTSPGRSPGTGPARGQETTPAGAQNNGPAAGLNGGPAAAGLDAAPEVSERDGAALPGGDGGPAATVPWLLSARSPASLAGYAGRLREFAAAHPELTAGDIAVSLAGRPVHPVRAVLASDQPDGFAAGLDALAAGEPAAGLVTGTAAGGRTVFVFPGQGSQWDGMAAGLLRESPVFRAGLDRCAAALERHTGWDVRGVLTGAPGSPPADRVDVIQPVLFAVMVSLAAVWRSLGVEPDAVIGHSQGEIAAACVAGALSLEDAAQVVALRSRALRRLAGTGGMVSVPRPAAEAGELIARWDGQLHIATLNGPGSAVVAGPPEPLAGLLAHCEASEIDARRIDVDYASHTPAVAAIEDELAGLLAGITPRPPRIPLYSTLTGEPLDGAAMDAGYWYANLASPVRFEPATRALLDSGHRLFIEVSPHPVLALGVQETAEAAGQDVVYGPTLRRGQGATGQLIAAAATAWTAGQPVSWAALLPPGRRAELPGYAFDRQRYWLGTPATATPAAPGRIAGHPLLPELTELAGSGGLLLAGSLSVARHPWLADHAVGGEILLPGTALADLAAVAGERTGCPQISELILEQPLVLPADGAVTVQVAVDAAGSDGARLVSVHSRPDGQGDQDSQPGAWARHAAGTLTDGQDAAPGDGQHAPRGDRSATPAAEPGEPWPPPGADPVDLDELYDRLTALGYTYGPAFHGLKGAWRHGDGLLADITLPGSAQPREDGYQLHPALLDPALHLLLDGTLRPAAEGTSPASPGHRLSAGQQEPASRDRQPGRAGPDIPAPASRDGRAGQAGLPDAAGPGDRGSAGGQDGAGPGGTLLPFCWTGLTLAGPGVTELRVRISPAGQDSWTLAGAAPDGRPVVAGTVTLRPRTAAAAHAGAEHRDVLLRVDWQPLAESPADQIAPHQPAPHQPAPHRPVSDQAVPEQTAADLSVPEQSLPALGVTGRAVPDPSGDNPDGWVTAGSAVPGAGRARVTDLAAVREPVPGVVICPVTTRDGAMPTAADETVAAVLRTVQDWLGEDRFAGSRLVLVTRNAVAAAPGDRVDGVAQAPVWGLIRSAQAENPGRLSLVDLDGHPAPDAVRAAIAAGADQAAVRGDQVLTPRLAPEDRPPLCPPPGGGPWRLDTAGRGLDRLVLRDSPEAARPLEPGQVRISVRAAGLNFRDITIATGLLPGEHGMGIEGAGVITETGPGVTHLAPGDAVLGLLRDAFGPVAVADARALAKIPDGWSFARAAAVPVAFLTAWDALAEVAAVQPGDSVLVHAAAGGVGLAATQVARHLGATVYGTASPGKHAATGLPNGHVASSRSLQFESQLRDAAGPPGLDVVLNCLAGEYTDASLRLLAPGGRFVEIGKTDLRDPAEVARAHPGVRYQAYNLMDLPPDRAGLLLREVLALFECGALTPPQVTAWDLRRAPGAFAHMRHARHTGKIVLTIPPPLDPDGTVLITGGTGALGALAARHLIKTHGARKVLLTSRRGPDAPGAGELADSLGKLGAEVRIAACDVADRDSLAQAVGGTRLTAVVHAAGVLDDGLVTGLTPSRLARVLTPKADAAWLLHELTAGHDLAAFVLFSSASGILGEPGQANYAAANASLDALAQYRRARGLPAISLAWGVWQQRSGMTGHLTGADLERLERTGMGALPSAAGLALLDTALAGDEALAVPMRLAQLPAAAAGPARADQGPAPADPAQPGDDQEQLLDLVRRHAAAALGHPDPGTVGPDQAFRDLGFDSLTGVELRNRLSSSTGLRLPAGLISDNPTPAAVTRYLRGRLASTGG